MSEYFVPVHVSARQKALIRSLNVEILLLQLLDRIYQNKRC